MCLSRHKKKHSLRTGEVCCQKKESIYFAPSVPAEQLSAIEVGLIQLHMV